MPSAVSPTNAWPEVLRSQGVQSPTPSSPISKQSRTHSPRRSRAPSCRRLGRILRTDRRLRPPTRSCCACHCARLLVPKRAVRAMRRAWTRHGQASAQASRHAPRAPAILRHRRRSRRAACWWRRRRAEARRGQAWSPSRSQRETGDRLDFDFGGMSLLPLPAPVGAGLADPIADGFLSPPVRLYTTELPFIKLAL